MKPFIKRDERMDARTDGHRAFYNLPSRAYRPAGDKNTLILKLRSVNCGVLNSCTIKFWHKKKENIKNLVSQHQGYCFQS